ncbi:hypothetical protein [Paenibacillus kribbensis]|uniref:hypothetical protein n=1 Tax=Paenibacillus kribbensis TaxID=172713 RepID=UPI000837CEFF|nr:hypothetical protein [Paenibacillus kribbensis]
MPQLWYGRIMLYKENVVNLADQLLVESKEIKDNPENHEIIRKIGEYIYRRVTQIKGICSVEKYNIFFNGKVAVGKSTAICNLFNLIDEDRFVVGKILSEAMLLKTASGRTTVCETVIVQTQDNESKIVIEATSIEDFKVLIKEYCKMITPNGNIGKKILSDELKRFIENMLEIPESITKNEEKYNYIKERLIVNVTTDKFEESLLEFLKYENRTKIEHFCNGDNFKKWLKDTYENINDGKLHESPLPKKITIYINKDDIDLGMPSFIDKIIDTRGIDGGERKDIQDAIMDVSSISIMCDEIGSFGENPNLFNILKQTLIKENQDLNFRVFITGIERGNELDKANSANGHRELGKKRKIGQVIDKLIGINYSSDNFIFYNSFYGIDYSNKSGKIYELDPSEYSKEKADFFGAIEHGLKRMYARYIKELTGHLENIQFLNQNSITKEAVYKLTHCKDIIYNAKVDVMKKTYDFIGDFKKEIMSEHPSVLRASVNRWGKYNSFNLYDMVHKLGGEEFQKKCFEIKTRMLGEISGLFHNGDKIESICKSSLESKINSEYDNFYKKNRESYFKITEAGLYNYHSWENPLTYWGDGTGYYKSRVSEDLTGEIRKKNVEQALNRLENAELFYDEILNFLDF